MPSAFSLSFIFHENFHIFGQYANTHSMSFNDIAAQSGKPGGAGASVDGMAILSQALQRYNAAANQLKQTLANSKRSAGVGGRGVDKSLIESKIRDCRDTESNVKVQLNIQMRKLDTQPKSEVAAKRLQVSKLQKDFERVKASVQVLLNSVDPAMGGDAGSKGSSASASAGAGAGATGGVGIADRDWGMTDQTGTGMKMGGGAGEGGTGGARVLQKLQGHEVDEAIAEERERDIKAINENLKLVNEMFRDVAELVEQQGAPIAAIVQSTEESHARAEAGLEQVQQAAKLQPGCIIA